MYSRVRKDHSSLDTFVSGVEKWALRGAIAASLSAIVVITINQIPSGSVELTEAKLNPNPTPEKATPKPAPVIGLLPLDEILAHNLKRGNPFRESVLDARYPRSGAGYESYLEQCSTHGGPEAIGIVQVPELHVRSTASEKSPILGKLYKNELVGYRLRLLMTRFGSRDSRVLALIEEGRNLNTAVAIQAGTEYIKNNPGTVCTETVNETALR